jgi:hypothetical protein
MNETSLEEKNNIPRKKFPYNLNRKELMYGFIVIFLLMSMYFLGQISTQMIHEQIKEVCPSLVVTSVSPFGFSYISKGTYIPNDSQIFVP